MYLHGFSRHQYFVDGNKRTALKSCLTLLNINGYDLDIDDFELYAFTERVAKKEIDEIETIAKWLKKYAYKLSDDS